MYPTADLFGQAIRNGGRRLTVVDAKRNGALVLADLPVLGGSITDDPSSDGPRRKLSCEIQAQPGLFDSLSPIGTVLEVRQGVDLGGNTFAWVPMGVFDIDVQSQGIGPDDSSISFTAPDKWVRLQRARFLRAQPSTPGQRVTDQIVALIRGGLGVAEPVNVLTANDTKMGAVWWDQDRAKAVQETAEAIGCYVYFDRLGVATIADLPTVGKTADWLVDASQSGILTGGSRERNRQRTYNVVVVTDAKADGSTPFDPVYTWDNDPTSPTYAGTEPIGAPETAGPFGIVPYFYSSPLIFNEAGAHVAAAAILAKTTGLASQPKAEALANPALDGFDVVDLLLPRERYDLPRTVERHIVDTVTHPLTLSGTQSITGRSTRTDAFT